MPVSIRSIIRKRHVLNVAQFLVNTAWRWWKNYTPPVEDFFFFSLALPPPWILVSDFQFHDHFTHDRTPWTSDQFVARPLPTPWTTQTQNKHTHIPNIHALCGIRTYESSFRASKDSTCLKPPGYCDRRKKYNIVQYSGTSPLLITKCTVSRYFRRRSDWYFVYYNPNHM
jgi:hypothetical protein